jgi:hypothetical protein
MKIKTITCHDVYNFGATLQAFALMKYLQNMGHDVTIIDYTPEYLSGRYSLFDISPKLKNKNFILKLIYLAIKLPGRLIRLKSKYSFDLFKKDYLNLTDKRYYNNTELKENPPNANVYIAGSDQIWNTLYENGRDPAFYLDFAPPEAKRVSYAASFSIPEILPEYKDFVKSMIEKIDHISVRERNGLDILKSISINYGSHVLDPVFLLRKNEWLELVNENFDEKYILVYDFDNTPFIKKFVKDMALKKNLKIYAMNNYAKTEYANRDFHNSGPKTFLSLIKNAEIVVGNSFHATAFSLIFEKQFYIFDRQTQNINSRMLDLVDLCQLTDRYISSENIEIKTKHDIDYQPVNAILNQYIKKSKQFLTDSLKEQITA